MKVIEHAEAIVLHGDPAVRVRYEHGGFAVYVTGCASCLAEHPLFVRHLFLTHRGR